MDITYDFWALGAVVAIFLIGLVLGGWRAGWFSPARNEGRPTLESQGGQQGGSAQGGTHTVPDPHTRGV